MIKYYILIHTISITIWENKNETLLEIIKKW